MKNYRIFVEKYPEFQVEARSLLNELNESLQLSLESLRYLNVYDLFGFTPELLEKSRYSVFGEIVTDRVTDECDLDGVKYIAVEYLPGQFDQRAASAVDCVRLLDPKAEVKASYSWSGSIRRRHRKDQALFHQRGGVQGERPFEDC